VSPSLFLPEDEGRSILRNVVIFKVIKYLKLLKTKLWIKPKTRKVIKPLISFQRDVMFECE
jgi:hypothetical protein